MIKTCKKMPVKIFYLKVNLRFQKRKLKKL